MFACDEQCTACDLSERARSVCLPSRRLDSAPGQADTAVFMLGEKPGVDEDRTGDVWCGPVGRILTGVYVKALVSELGSHPIHIYGNNVVRCAPPVDSSVTSKQAKACRQYLEADLLTLEARYDRVLLLACGGPACKSVGFSSLSTGLRGQGTPLPGHSGITAFATYNPGMLLEGRDPSAIAPITDHLQYVVDWVLHNKIPMEVGVPPADLAEYKIPREAGTMVAIDVETYGAVDGLPEQTVFHPEKSLRVDGCPPEELVQCAAAAWKLPDGTIDTAFWVLPRALVPFRAFLRSTIESGRDLLGQNTAFDIMYLRAIDCDDILDRPYMQRHGSRLLDLAVTNFLESDMRPERSLKQISPLLRVLDYDGERSLKDGFRYSSRRDPELREYNCADVVATLECWDRLATRIRSKFPGTAKLSRYCLDWYSDCLWSAVDMNEAGVEFDRDKLEALAETQAQRMARCVRLAEGRWKGIMGGKGSGLWLRNIMVSATEEAGLVGDPRVARTRKPPKRISCSNANRNLLLGALPMGSRTRGILRTVQKYQTARKIVSSYTTPLLTHPQKGLVGSRALPTWFVVPSRQKDDTGGAGGTKQGRMTCQNPGLQTIPPCIKACITSRFSPGVVLDADLSQIEMRMMAILSGDPVMMQEYRDGVDRHLLTAVDILGELGQVMVARGMDTLYGVTKEWLRLTMETAACSDRFNKGWPGIGPWRHLGKTINFLIGFRGGAGAFQATARTQLGIELDLGFCQATITATARKYRRLIEWQDENIERAVRNGYLEMPLIGDSRWYLGGAKIRHTYTPHICNQPVQYTAACILKGALRECLDDFRARGMRAVIGMQIYDSLYPDMPAEEEAEVRAILNRRLACPSYYRRLQLLLGRQLPLGHEIKVVARTEGLP